MRNVYVCTCELLRHFWRSFPPTTPQLEEKAIRMHEALHRFHSAKLKPFEVSCVHYILNLYTPLCMFSYIYAEFLGFRIVFNETFPPLASI